MKTICRSLMILLSAAAILLLPACASGVEGDHFTGEQEPESVVKEVSFTEQELNAAIGTLNGLSDRTVATGASSWGLDTMRNRVIVWLDPFTDEQIALFVDFLTESSIPPAIVIIEPAVTQEMIEQREASIATAMLSADNRISHLSTASVSGTGILFTLKNTTDMDFFYGSRWDMAYYSDGRWLPVQHLPGKGGGAWTDELYSLQSGDSEEFKVDWEWRFGELPPGKYAYIRSGYFGEYSPDHEVVYATVEFHILEAGQGYMSFIALLADSGLQFTETGAESDGFLSVPGRPVYIGDDLIMVFEYRSNALMQTDVSCIDIDGCSIHVPGREVNISWVSHPHFFKKATLIVNYVGENEIILDFLRANFGEPFAGYGCAG